MLKLERWNVVKILWRAGIESILAGNGNGNGWGEGIREGKRERPKRVHFPPKVQNQQHVFRLPRS